uniref:Uncharacterized protein n=1 Tax=Aegilops tauschii subsp. strangulata TaxID=200361 RepID=A0A453J070_AEGTS
IAPHPSKENSTTHTRPEEEGKREARRRMRQASRFKRMCVFCGSSQGNKSSYHDAAIDLANQLVRTPTHQLMHPSPPD